MSGLIARVLFAPKSGAEEAEWEDAAAYSERRGVMAVADGASASYRSARWSSALVDSFVSEPPELAEGLESFLEWVQRVGDRFQADSEAISETSWYASDASRRGSFATFCAVQLRGGSTPRFRAVQVGDACLFHCRGDHLVTAPLDDPDSFGSTPDLLGSTPYRESYGAEAARFVEAAVRGGDVLFLTTDALGAAMLRLAAAGQPVWSYFAAVGVTGFDQVVSGLREADVMEDDDVTLLRVRVPQEAR